MSVFMFLVAFTTFYTNPFITVKQETFCCGVVGTPHKVDKSKDYLKTRPVNKYIYGHLH